MNSKKLKIVFMGTPNFALGVLENLIKEKYNIVAIVTVADKPAGRGKQLLESPVKKFAIEKGIKILQPTNLKDEQFILDLKILNPDIQIVVAFRMLPKVVWEIPEYGTFNLHASLLPSYRGAAPINWAIINGEKETGVTTFFIDEKIDTGRILLQEKVDISKVDTAGLLHDKLLNKGCQLVQKTIEMIASGNIETIPQPEIDLKVAPKIFKNNCKIDWENSLEVIYNFVRGLSPYPTAWTNIDSDGEKIEVKIFNSSVEYTNHNYQYRSIICSKKEMKIALDGGFLQIEELQLPSKKRMIVSDLLNGYKFSEDAKVC